MKNSIAIDANFLIDIVIDRDGSSNAMERLTTAMTEYDAIFVPFGVIIEFIHFLQDVHKAEHKRKLSKDDIIEKVNAILATPKFVVENRKNLQTALSLYHEQKIEDAVMAATLINNNISAILSNDSYADLTIL